MEAHHFLKAGVWQIATSKTPHLHRLFTFHDAPQWRLVYVSIVLLVSPETGAVYCFTNFSRAYAETLISHIPSKLTNILAVSFCSCKVINLLVLVRIRSNSWLTKKQVLTIFTALIEYHLPVHSRMVSQLAYTGDVFVLHLANHDRHGVGALVLKRQWLWCSFGVFLYISQTSLAEGNCLLMDPMRGTRTNRCWRPGVIICCLVNGPYSMSWSEHEIGSKMKT